jgi:hypothetical protein
MPQWVSQSVFNKSSKIALHSVPIHQRTAYMTGREVYVTVVINALNVV